MVGKSQVVEVGVGVVMVMALPFHYRKKMVLPVVALHFLDMDFLLETYLYIYIITKVIVTTQLKLF